MYQLEVYRMDGVTDPTPSYVPGLHSFSDLEFTQTLSGVDSMRFTLDNPIGLKDGKIGLVPWGQMIVVRHNGVPQIGAAVSKVTYEEGSRITVECIGLLGLTDVWEWPLPSPISINATSPAYSIFDWGWALLQNSSLRRKLGIVLGDTDLTTPHAISDDPEEFYELSRKAIKSMLSLFTEMASVGRFDFWLEWGYSATDENLAVATLRRRKQGVFGTTHHLVVGDHVITAPAVENAENYTNRVVAWGKDSGDFQHYNVQDSFATTTTVDRSRVYESQRRTVPSWELKETLARFGSGKLSVPTEIPLNPHKGYTGKSFQVGDRVVLRRFYEQDGSTPFGGTYTIEAKIVAVRVNAPGDQVTLSVVNATPEVIT